VTGQADVVVALWEPAAQAARTGRTADLLALVRPRGRVRHLLDRGADPRRVDTSGANPAEHARRMGAQRSAAVLAAARRKSQPNPPSATA
jgi:hypothetical protein